MLKKQEKIINFLLENKRFTSEQVKTIIKEAEAQGVSPDEYLEDKHILPEKEIIQAKSAIFSLPPIELYDFSVPNEILKILPKKLAETYQVVVFALENKILKVALLNPLEFKAREAVEFIAKDKGFSVEYFVTGKDSFKSVLVQYGGLAIEVEEALAGAEEKFAPVLREKVRPEAALEEAAQMAPITKLFASILKYAVDNRASDIHIESVGDKTRVRYRIDGVLRSTAILPGYIHSALISRVKVMANLKLDETRIPQDGRIRVVVSGRNIDIRVSTLPLLDKEKIALRILDPAQQVFTLENLGFWGNGLEKIKRNLERPHGMILVTGPTGCGKTTTLYAMLKLFNREEVNIVTLEDPIEYFVEGVNQSHIRTEIGYTFAAGIRSVVRQDPNIVMVGEIRDNETAELAVHAALTGHIVLSTLHTNDAFGAIPRLIDMKIEPFLISSSLNIIIAQRLVRRICDNCREEMILPAPLEEIIIRDLKTIPDFKLEQFKTKRGKLKFYRGRGCPNCKREGYKERTSIFEVLEITEQMKKIITSGCQIDEVRQEFGCQKLILMRQEGLIKALQGITTVEEVMRAARE